MVQKSFLIVLLLLLLSSCSSTDKPIEVITAPINIPLAQLPDPSPIVVNNINWKIINLDNKIYYGLSVSDYELLAINMLEIKRYILAQKNIIVYYRQNTTN
jgi:hypothetical protein